MEQPYLAGLCAGLSFFSFSKRFTLTPQDCQSCFNFPGLHGNEFICQLCNARGPADLLSTGFHCTQLLIHLPPVVVI